MTGERTQHTVWSRDHYWTGLTLVAAALMLAAPLWAVWAPAMPDYPAHLASFELIKQGGFFGLGGSGARGNAIYHLDWRFVPNLASEVLVPWLARLTGTVAAAKLFLSTAIFLWVLGPGAVHRALYGRTGIAPLFGAFFAYNANFIWGFFNYDFSAGLSFLMFAAWIATDRRNGAARLAGFALAVTILYFCHIFAAAILLLMIAGFETAQTIRHENRDPKALARRAGRVALLYGPAALAFVFLKPRSDGEGATQFNLLDTMLDRFESLTQHAFDNPAYVLPILLFAGLALAVFMGKARIHPALWGSLALLLLGSLFAPEWALGGWAVHLRLPAVFASLLFAATEIRMKPLLRGALATAALVMIAISAVTLAQSWRGYDRQYREFIASLQGVPRGARLLTVLDGDALGMSADQPYWHMAEFAVPLKDAFTPLLFTTRGQHVVQLNPPFDKYAAATAQQGSPPDIDELNFLARGDMGADPDMAEDFPYLDHFQCHFDIAVVVHLGGKRSIVPPMLVLRSAHSFFSLYDIKPDKSCAK
jgi:hypothetical protein